VLERGKVKGRKTIVEAYLKAAAGVQVQRAEVTEFLR
jgi:hypothetical protein